MRNQNIVHLALTTLFCLFLTNSFASDSAVNITIQNKDFSIGNITVNDETPLEDVLNIFGKPSREKEYPGEKSFFYDDLGIIVMSRNQGFNGIGLNLNWDGDERFPEKSFTGSLIIDNVAINKNSNINDIKKLTAYAVECMSESICITVDDEAPMTIMVGFQNNKITQIIGVYQLE